MERCRTLQEYSQFVGIVREYAETQKLSDSVMAEILQKCRAENILKEFLEKYGTEVIGMLFEVLTEEEARELSRQDGFELAEIAELTDFPLGAVMLLSNMEERQGGDKMCRNEKRRNDVWLHAKPV